MTIIGLTGGFGTGKTTVARMFISLGAEVIDADKIAHTVIKPPAPAYYKTLAYFGPGILKNKSCHIDRKKLAKIVFKQKYLLKHLNKIIHPEVIKIIKEQIKKSKSKILVIDAPLLIEAGLDRLVDKLIVVKLDKDEQLKRLRKKTGLDNEEILRRISRQLPLGKKLRQADFVIDNNGTLFNTRRQVKNIWNKLNP